MDAFRARCDTGLGTGCEIIDAERASILDAVTAERGPRVALELGTRVGYASLRLAAQMKCRGGHVFTVEMDPLYVAVARSIFVAAGVDDLVTSLVGHPRDSLPAVLQQLMGCSGQTAKVDLLLLHGGCEARYLGDLSCAEELGLLSPCNGCTVVADHVLRPGAPCFLWSMHADCRYDMKIVKISETDIRRGGLDGDLYISPLSAGETE